MRVIEYLVAFAGVAAFGVVLYCCFVTASHDDDINGRG